MTAGRRLAAVALVWTFGGGLTGVICGLLMQALTVIAAPCAVSDAGIAAGLPACAFGPSLTLLAAEFAFLGLLIAAVGLMVMPGMRLDFVEAQADLAAAAQARALDARARPVPLVPIYVLPLAVR
jgi:uncharacterized membrane protein